MCYAPQSNAWQSLAHRLPIRCSLTRNPINWGIPAGCTKSIGTTLRRNAASSNPSRTHTGPAMKTQLLRLTALFGLALLVVPLTRVEDATKEAEQGVFDQLAAVTGSVVTGTPGSGAATPKTATQGSVPPGT